MSCYNFGDPHFTTFSNQKHNAMGHGEYILMQTRVLMQAGEDFTFSVHVCHQPGDKPEVSQNTGVAITSQWGVLKFNHKLDSSRPPMPDGSGITLEPHTPSFGINTITFPSGEVVQTQNAGGVTTVNLPASYCGNVYGLCGAYDPADNFASTFAVRDETMSVFSGSSAQRWGGLYGGEFQSQFADSWKVAAADSEALFTAEECPSGDSYTGEAPQPFADCPELEADAKAQCPVGDLYELCLADVGIMCDLEKWVGAASTMVTIEDSTLAPSHPPTSAPTLLAVVSKEPCNDAHSCDAASTQCMVETHTDGSKQAACECLDGYVPNTDDADSCVYYPWAQVSQAVVDGKACITEKSWMDLYGDENTCMHRVLADTNCDPNYFNFSPSDGNCQCVEVDTDCSAAANQEDADSEHAIYAIITGSADPAAVLSAYNLVATNKRCDGGDWFNEYGDEAACMHRVRARPECHQSYFMHTRNDGNCRCAYQNSYCGSSSYQSDDNLLDLYEIKSTTGYQLMATQKSCTVSMDWMNKYGTEADCLKWIMEDPAVSYKFFGWAPGDGNCRGVRRNSDCSDNSNLGFDSGVNLYRIVTQPPPAAVAEMKAGSETPVTVGSSMGHTIIFMSTIAGAVCVLAGVFVKRRYSGSQDGPIAYGAPATATPTASGPGISAL
jgi:hypothetical protein